MRKRVAIFSKNQYFAQKVRLLLEDLADFTDSADIDIAFIDDESADVKEAPSARRVIRIGKSEDCDIKSPFSADELVSSLIDDMSSEKITLGERCAYFKNEKISLTDVEFSLLALLLSRKGEFISRDELLLSVWHGERGESVLNVYIHYLREKLERSGEKIILSSRKNGYKIDKKYTKDDKNDRGCDVC